MERLNVLFVTRKFPPSTGGMENAAFELHKELAKRHNVTLVAWGGSNKFLPVIYPWLLIRSICLLIMKKYDIVYLQDGLMSPMGVVLRALTGVPTVVTVHGLDITYRNKLYQLIIRPSLKAATQICAVSSYTKEQIQQRITHRADIAVINNGVRDIFYDKKATSKAIRSKLLDEKIIHSADQKILLTSGRLVKRKGVDWFINFVLGDISKKYPNLIYLVCGSGREKDTLEASVERQGLQKHIKLLGRVSQERLVELYNVADIFIMPNVTVPGDMEGFGIVVLEATSCGTPVVAAGIEGITDAVRENQTGIIVPSRDAGLFKEAVDRLLNHEGLSRKSVRQKTLEYYSWSGAANNYSVIFEELSKKE